MNPHFLRGKVCKHQSGTWKSNLILDKEQSDQVIFGVIINNQIGLVKVQKINREFPFTTLVHLALIHIATSAKTPS